MITQIITTLFFVLLVTSRCGASDNITSEVLVNEFISLDEKANYEHGNIVINGEVKTLEFSGTLFFRPSIFEEYQNLGVAFFGEDDTDPLVIMSTEDGEIPDFQKMEVNIPDTKNGYSCNNITHQTQKSTMIEQAAVFIVKAFGCTGKGKNAGSTNDINMKITQSVLVSGASKIEIIDGKAYLNTEIKINDHFLIIGDLGTKTYNQIFDLIVNNPEITTLVLGKIGGSIHDDINMQTGRLIRKAGLSIHADSTSNIASGGVDLFCSGKKRTAEDGAKFNVHSWSGDDGIEGGNLPIDSPLHDDQIAYFNEMLGNTIGKDFYFFTLNAASADEIHQMDKSEIILFHLFTE